MLSVEHETLALARPESVTAPSPRRGGTSSLAELLERLAVVLVTVAIVFMPLLRPVGPGNSAPVDVAVLLAVVVTTLAALAARAIVRLPYLVPVVLMIVAGAVGAIFHEATTEAVVTLSQDLLVFLFAAVIVNACRTPRAIGVVLRAWAISSIVWAGVMVTAVLIGAEGVAGVTARTGTRASLTFGDANLAASYFVISFLVVYAARSPRRAALRWCAYVLLAAAVVLTGSLGGMLSLGVALGVLGVCALVRRIGVMAAIAIMVFIVPFAFIVGRDTYDSLSAHAQDPNSALHDSLGRTSSSSTAHDRILSEDLNLLAHASLLGDGPTATKTALAREQVIYVKEAHNDYLAVAIERGALGVVSLAMLVGVIVVRSRRALARAAEPSMAIAVPRIPALIAAVAAVACTGMFYEVLHFRQVWALLGVVAAIGLASDR